MNIFLQKVDVFSFSPRIKITHNKFVKMSERAKFIICLFEDLEEK